MSAESILELLPWRHPFLLIDRMVECSPHRSIVTEKRISCGDPLVRDGGAHGPWFPSLLLLEGLSQTAALLYKLSYAESAAAELPLLGFLRASLHGSGAPGDLLTFRVAPAKMTRHGGVFEGRASAGPVLLAEAELAFSAARAGEGTKGEHEADV